MLHSIQKARSWSSTVRTSGRRMPVPGIFRPPLGGAAYFGQAYRFEQILHFKYWAFIAIRALMNEIAGGAPPNFGEIRYKEKRQQQFRHLVYKSAMGPQEHEEFIPYEHTHPLCQVFRNPNDPDVAYDLWAFHTLFLSLTGIAYWWVIRNGFGMPVEIWVVPTHWVRLLTDGDGQPEYYNVQSPWGHAVDVPYSEMVAFYEHSPLNRYEGAAVSQAVSEWIDVYESLTRMKLATFKNNATPSLHVSLGESYIDPDDQFLARFYAKWFQKFQGEDNSSRPLITGADVEVKGIDGHRPADALMASIQSEDQIRDMVLAAYGVPKGVVGIEPVSDVSAYAPQRQFCRFTINPKLNYAGQVITEKIVKKTKGCENGLCFWDDRVANDQELIERQLDADERRGWITPNEGRTVRGRPEYPNGGKNPLINGQEMPWVTGKVDDGEVAQAFKAALSEASGAQGGYLIEQKRRRGR